MNNEITSEKLDKYFDITGRALKKTKQSINPDRKDEAKEIIEMADNYYSDAKHFHDKGDTVNAFAALNYAHGWLDCGARLRIFTVKDNVLFTVDGE